MKKVVKKLLACAFSAALACSLVPAAAGTALADENGVTVTVNTTVADGLTYSTSYTTAQLESMAVDASAAPAYYIMNGTTVYEVTKYIPASSLFKGAGWNSSSTFNFDGRGKGGPIEYSYEAGNYYPNFLNTSDATANKFNTTGAVATPMALALEYKTISIADGDTAAAAVENGVRNDPQANKAISWVANAPESMYSNGADSTCMYGNVFWGFATTADIVINVSTQYNLPASFTVNSTSKLTNAAVSKTYTAAELDAMVVDASAAPLKYNMNGNTIYNVTKYIPASALFAGAGWNEGSTFNFADRGKGGPIEYSYEAGNYYPNFLNSSSATTAEKFNTTDAVATPMVLALSYQTYSITDGDTAAAATEKTAVAPSKTSKAMVWAANAPESMYSNGADSTCMYGNVFWGYTDASDITANVAAAFDLSAANITIANKTYNGKAQAIAPVVTASVKLPSGRTTTVALENGVDYTVSAATVLNAGSYELTISGKGDCSGVATKTVTVAKAANTMTAKAKKASFKKNAKKAQKTTIKVASAQGKVTYKSSSKKVTVSKSGKVTIKKGFKGTAKITVKAAGDANHLASSKVVKITVK